MGSFDGTLSSILLRESEGMGFLEACSSLRGDEERQSFGSLLHRDPLAIKVHDICQQHFVIPDDMLPLPIHGKNHLPSNEPAGDQRRFHDQNFGSYYIDAARTLVVPARNFLGTLGIEPLEEKVSFR